MYSFDFFNPVKALFGAGRLGSLHEQSLPGKKALVVISAGGSVRRFGYLDKTLAELDLAGVGHEVFAQIRANPTVQNVADGAQAAQEGGCDFVVALGGGSVMDCAKCIALMATNPGKLWDYSLSAHGGKRTPEHDALPIVCITTSAGTASEVDIGAVISNDEVQEKSAIFHPSMFPTLAVVDSDLTLSVPPELTAWQGMDAFFHASETVINPKAHPMALMFALKAVELIAHNLPVAVKDGSDREARFNMSLANSLAGYYMLCTSAHTMEHVMGSFHPDLVHGAGLVMIAKAYYGFFAERGAAEDSMRSLATAMGVANARGGDDFMQALSSLIEQVGCSGLTMSGSGITPEELQLYPAKVHEVIGGDITADPLPLTDEDYLEIYRRAFA